MIFIRPFALCLLFSCLSSHAGAAIYRPILNPLGSTGLSFSIPYTLGNHEGFTKEVRGAVEIDPDTLTVSSGEVYFPITSLTSGNKKRDCHMFEALGLDYSKSKFPNAHVCGISNQIPESGNDSISFPEIRYKLTPSGGTFEMHGVSRVLNPVVKISKNTNGEIHLETSFTLSLSDYGITVKPVLGVTVEDTVTVSVDLLLSSP